MSSSRGTRVRVVRSLCAAVLVTLPLAAGLAVSPAHAAQPSSHQAAWSTSPATPRATAINRPRGRTVRPAARSSALLESGDAFCGYGKITFDPPAVSTTLNASDWVRWRALVWTWNGSSWGNPTTYAWTPYSLVNGWYEFPPAQVRVPGGRYYHVQYQAEHYYAGQTVTANQVSHFGLGTGVVTGSSTYCAAA